MFAGHRRMSHSEMVSKVVLWAPTHGQRKQGRPALSYIASLTKETSLPADEIGNCMKDSAVWRSITARQTDEHTGCFYPLTWSMHLIIFVNNAMRQAHGFCLMALLTKIMRCILQVKR